MLAIVSPSKDMARSNVFPMVSLPLSRPEFIGRSARLMDVLKTFSPNDLAERMHINKKIAEENFIRFSQWKSDVDVVCSFPSVYAYTGEAFRGLEAIRFDEEQLGYANRVLRILSGLYGVLRPLDYIQPYRLEMGQKEIKFGGKDLYAVWNKDVTHSIVEAIEQSPGEKVLVNLASNEYFKVINGKKFPYRVVVPEFKEEGHQGLKVVTVYTKKARGLMARFIVENQIENPNDLRSFDLEGYYYNHSLSDTDRFVFVRM